MQRIALGQSGLQVSPLALGAMYFGTKTDQTQSERLLDAYLAQGGNFIDTANNYAFWMENGVGDESETVLGHWLRRQPRDRIVLASKCGARPRRYGGSLDDIELEGLRKDTIIQAVEGSLRRLQTDYLDLLYGHIDFAAYPIEERLEAFAALQQAGKVRAFGTSNTWAWRIEESQRLSQEKGYPSYCAVQQKYSYLRPKPDADFWVQRLIDPALLDYAKARPALTLVAYSTLLSGLYARGPEAELPPEYDLPENRQRLQRLHATARELGCTANQLVLAWLRQHEAPLIPLISGSQVAQIEESMGALTLRLDAATLRQLNRV